MSQESEQVVAIKQRYRASLKDKAVIVANYIADCQGQINEPELDELNEFFHKLAGSSGMYGFDDIAKRCRKIMAIITSNDQTKLLKQLNKTYSLLIEHAQ